MFPPIEDGDNYRSEQAFREQERNQIAVLPQPGGGPLRSHRDPRWLPRWVDDIQIAIHETSLNRSSCGAGELGSLVALVIEDHGQNERRHDAGDDPGGNVTEKL